MLFQIYPNSTLGQEINYMRINRILCAAFLLMFSTAPLNATRIEDVDFNERHTAQEKALTLRGVALLRYMVIIKAYVGAFYLDENLTADQLFRDGIKRL